MKSLEFFVFHAEVISYRYFLESIIIPIEYINNNINHSRTFNMDIA